MIHPDRHKIVDLISRALSEDIGSGDITSRAILEPGKEINAQLIAKEDCIVCGLWVFEKSFFLMENNIRVKAYCKEGDSLKTGKMVAEITGLAEPVLSAERTALNFLQRLSGIATSTRACVDAIRHTKAVILDTRKTIPGFRILDKHAVKIGGGQNHRMGLFDMVLIKDNHISAAGGIKKSVQMVRKRFADKYKIELEVKNLEELKEALTLKVDRILLDNMSIEDMTQSVKMSKGKIKLEASGNITLQNVKAVAETGIDYISVGSLTHSVKATDYSLLIKS